MPLLYLSNELYDELVRRGKDVGEFVEKAVVDALKKEEARKKNEKKR